MTKAKLLEAFNAGKILLVGKAMHFKKEVIAYRDRSTGKPATFDKVEFAVLGANGVVFVQPDTRKIPGFDMGKYENPFKPGQDVVVTIDTMSVDKGITTISGTVESLD